ncbi:hypothetical protein BO82DRAFT_112250 [Aspergillus uvarum CBS 121591]|uniref:Uncharacterized protein n=1 Tax=Aspergillus uvarum CBS 121591 TaxID=1448315 RepID=A0A319C9D6_9EURO|nr:hypothetical protein BO82DRAFT_112250 [Aspergillus uvarum CBS 121591]PYH80307.1 hypothetical protein BO82DRAFT_112250 [Aspergillus uvarum CBS 121591]
MMTLSSFVKGRIDSRLKNRRHYAFWYPAHTSYVAVVYHCRYILAPLSSSPASTRLFVLATPYRGSIEPTSSILKVHADQQITIQLPVKQHPVSRVPSTTHSKSNQKIHLISVMNQTATPSNTKAGDATSNASRTGIGHRVGIVPRCSRRP